MHMERRIWLGSSGGTSSDKRVVNGADYRSQKNQIVDAARKAVAIRHRREAGLFLQNTASALKPKIFPAPMFCEPI